MRVCRLRSATGNICAHAWHWWSQTATMTTREPMTTQRNYYYCCYSRDCRDYCLPLLVPFFKRHSLLLLLPLHNHRQPLSLSDHRQPQASTEPKHPQATKALRMIFGRGTAQRHETMSRRTTMTTMMTTTM